ncbi:MAG: class A beta-lactamase-related serine hydrolase [Gemmatimonadota bacterium]|nr:class A beta-lactamase-related serine hydrolase [Gemmatimonadota bacterium]
MTRRTPAKAPAPSLQSPTELHARFAELEAKAGATSVAVVIADLETGAEFHYHADRWFHAASTIKVAILVGVFGAIFRGELLPQSRVHVRNRFLSAYDGSPYRVRLDRDANPDVHREVGRTLRVSELAEAMITTSSNLATNLLLDLIGLDVLQRTLESFDLHGIDLRRGVEDEKAFDHGINNRVTANGLVGLLRLIGEERAFSPELSRRMLDILHAQHFKSGIPAGLPRGARVAHKTGEISTIAHDAGLVYLPGRKPYALAVLTEWDPSGTGRSATIAAASYLAYAALIGDRD